jgi:Transglycosylase SLT domain
MQLLHLRKETTVSGRFAEICNGRATGIRRKRSGAMHSCAAAIAGALLCIGAEPQIAQASVQFSPQLEGAIQRASERYSMPQSTLRAFAAIESGGNSRAKTGSYYGVYQLSHSEFRKYGGRGNIFDPKANTDIAARKLRSESDAFSRQYGRVPTATELYMVHQQGVGGAAMHMANPDWPAWLNMYLTDEGRRKGPEWARLAIWGNVPADQRAQFPGGVNSITSRQFMDMWETKMARFGGSARDAYVGAVAAGMQSAWTRRRGP